MAKKNIKDTQQHLVSPKAYAALEKYYTEEYAQMLEPSPFMQAMKKQNPSQGLDSGIALQSQYATVTEVNALEKSITVNLEKAANPKFELKTDWYLSDAEKDKAGKVYTYKVVPEFTAPYYNSGNLDWADAKLTSPFFGIDKSTTHTFKVSDIVQNKVPYPDTWTHGEVLELTDYGQAIIAVLFPQDRQDVTFQVYVSTLMLVPQT